MIDFFVARKNTFFIGICILLVLISCFAATVTYRPEMADGYRMLFNMMSGRPAHGYINERQIQLVIQSIGYLTPFLKSSHFNFKEIYLIVNFFVAFFPVLIFIFTLALLYVKNIHELIPFLCLNYAMSILPTYSFHVSLVPESISFAWIAFIVWFYPPQGWSNWFYAIIGLSAVILYSVGYESTLIIVFIFLFHFIYSWKTNKYKDRINFEYAYKMCFLLLAAFMIYHRLVRVNTTGVFFISLKQLLTSKSESFLYLVFSTISIIVFQFIKKEHRNLIVLINLILGLYLFLTIPDSLWDGLHMRIMSILACVFIMLLAIYNLKGHIKTVNFQNLVIVIFLINFIYDLKNTKQWVIDRQTRKEELAKGHNHGCYALKHDRWTLSYESVLFQETFSPEYVVLQLPSKSYFFPYPEPTDGDPCKFILSRFNNQKIPQGLSGELAIKTFDFQKIEKFKAK